MQNKMLVIDFLINTPKEIMENNFLDYDNETRKTIEGVLWGAIDSELEEIYNFGRNGIPESMTIDNNVKNDIMIKVNDIVEKIKKIECFKGENNAK